MPLIAGQRYLASTAVFMNEVVKLTVCLTFSLFEIARTLPPSMPATSLFSGMIGTIFAGDSWKLAVPASLYVLQNSLQYIAISNLDSVTFQVTYQFKIIPTAFFSVLLLKRSLTPKQWLSLALLMVGVGIVQIPARNPALAPFEHTQSNFHFPRTLSEWRHIGNPVTAPISNVHKRSATYEGIAEDESLIDPQMNAVLGFAAAIGGSIVSAGASVYFEKILKDSETQASLWVRNVQLAFYSLFPALFIGVMFVDGEEIAQHGFFVGYNWFVWTTIGVQACGGVLVSLCVKYADNIAKSFAMSISILVSLCASVWFFDFAVTTNFLIGTSIVIFSTYLYNSSIERALRPPPIRIHDYEKTTIDKSYSKEKGHAQKLPTTPLKDEALSSSRPGSPRGHHSRVGSSRAYFGSKDRDD
ncbi:UDP-galactose transporter Gms1 [Lecanora helva]